MKTFEHLATNPFTYVVVAVVLFLGQRLWSLTRPRLCFTKFETGDDAAPGPEPATMLRALIRVEVHRLAAIAKLPDGRPLRFDLAGPYDDHYDLGSLSDGLPPVWKQVVTLLGMLISTLGSRARVVTGILLPREQVVLGIETIHGGVRRTDTLRAEDVDFFPDTKQDGLARLALPAAAWIVLEAYPGATLGGTPDWRSYVTFAAAYAWQNRGDADDEHEARRLYTKACEDPRNTAAAINLAALEELDERQAGTVYSDPMQRPSARRLARAVDLTARRRAADPEAAISSPDLQWFRARYLLSLSLRDYVDRLRAAAAGQAPAGEQVAEDTAAAALDYAVQMTLALIDDGSDLPEDFVRFGRAAAFTLVARQAFPPVTSTNADQIAVAGQDRSDLSEAGLRAALRGLQKGTAEPGTAERIVRYVRTRLPTDDQTEYNMVWYQLTRARILRTAFIRWENVSRNFPGRSAGPRPGEAEYLVKVERWQRMLASQWVIADREARASRARVERAGDPVLVGLLPSLDRDEETASPELDPGGRMRRLAQDSNGLDFENLEPPEENPTFDVDPPEGPDAPAPTPRRPDGPAGPAPDSARTQPRVERTVPGSSGQPVRPDPSDGRVGGNGAPVRVAAREEPPRWRQWLRRLFGRSGPRPG